MLLTAVVNINKIRWVAPTCVMVAPSPLIFAMIQALQFIKPIVSSSAYEYLDETIWSTFQRTVLCFFSNMNGTQVVYSGDYEPFLESKENALVISNHQTNVDWIAIDMLTVQQNLMGRIRFMHKDELKYIPLFGLYFWQHSCINVGRHGTFSEAKTVKQLNHLVENEVPTWMVIFPEGTRYNPEKRDVIAKSQRFAENNGLAVLKQSLTPRYRGTYLALRELHSHLDVVYDITIAYESTRKFSSDSKGFVRSAAPGMVAFILSYAPKLHVNVRKIDMKDIPRDDEKELIRWLHGLFERKDRLLETFIETGQFEEGAVKYRPVTRWGQTIPYNCLYLGMVMSLMMFRQGRIFYTSSLLIGGLAGLLWMKFH